MWTTNQEASRNAVQANGDRDHAQAGKAASFRAHAAIERGRQGAHRTTQVC